jgi:hypothetical protein
VITIRAFPAQWNRHGRFEGDSGIVLASTKKTDEHSTEFSPLIAIYTDDIRLALIPRLSYTKYPKRQRPW